MLYLSLGSYFFLFDGEKSSDFTISNLYERLFIPCTVIGSLTPILSVAFKKMANSPDVKYTPDVGKMPLVAPVKRSMSDSARDTFLNQLEQRVFAKLEDIDGGRPVSKQPFFMSYGKRTKPLFAEYGKRSFSGITSLWARNFNSYKDLH